MNYPPIKRRNKLRRNLALTLTLSFALTWGTPAGTETLWNKLSKDVRISGSKTLSYRWSKVSGNEDVYHDENYWGKRSSFNDYTELNIEGKVLRYFSFNTRLTSNRYLNEQPRLLFAYENKKSKVSVGDLYATLSGNQLMPFSRNLKGVMVESQLGKVKFQTLFSQTKAQTKKVVIRGNNSPGPYFLGAYSIMDGSERVRVDDIDKTLGKDYTIEYYTGSITFTQTILESSLIAVEFESRDMQSDAGTIWGTRMSMPFLKDRGTMGFTYLTQRSNASGSIGPIGAREDILAAYNNSPGPYTLSYPNLIVGSEIVQVDGVPLQRDVEYTINYRTGTLFFLRPVLETSRIQVTYSYHRDDSQTPNRSVMGLDVNTRISKNLDMSYQFARSAAVSADKGAGAASNLRLTGRFGKLNMAAGIKNTSPTFSSLESVGFNRSEKGTDFSFDYTPSSAVRLFGQMYNYKRAISSYTSSLYGSSASTSQEGFTTAKQTVYGINMNFPKWPEINLTRTRMVSGGGVYSYMSALTTDNLSLKHSFGKLMLTGDLLLSKNSTTGSSTDSTGNNLYDPSRASTASKTTRLGVSYQPSTRLSLSGDISTSSIKSGDTDTTSRNIQLTANLRDLLLRNLNVSLNYRVANSGGVVGSYLGGYGTYPIDTGSLYGYNTTGLLTSSRQTGYGTDYGSGYGTGTGYNYGSYGYGGMGSRSVSQSIGIQYSPSERLSFNMNLDRTVSDYDGGSNTDSNNHALGFTYAMWKDAVFSAQYSTQKSAFLRTAGGDLTNQMQFYSLRFPVQKFTFNFQYQFINSDNNYSPLTNSAGSSGNSTGSGYTGKDGTDTGYGTGYGSGYGYGYSLYGNRTNMKAWTARVEYPIAERKRLFLDWQRSSLLGGYDISKSVIALGMEYDLNRFLTLSVDVRDSKNNSQYDSRYNYRALSLNADISARF